MTWSMTVRVDALPPMSNAARPLHWAARTRERKRWALLLKQAFGLARHHDALPLMKARVTFTRYSSRKPDHGDNLNSSFKQIRDLLTRESKKNPMGLGIVWDDDPDHFEAEYKWEKAPRGHGFVTITVEEI